MASYLIHNNDNFTIKLVTPSDSAISVSDDQTYVNITIPKGTYMGIGTTIGVGGTDGQYFNYNFCSYVTVVFKNLAGTSSTQVPLAKTINTMRPQASEKLSTSYFPGLTEFKKFNNNVVLFHTGNASSNQWNWKETLNSDKTIQVEIPDDANSYEVYISGCSMNTTTYRRYVFDPKVNGEDPITGWTIPAWATNPTSIGGNSCGHQHDSDEFLSVNLHLSPNKPLSSRIKPISTNIRVLASADKITGLFGAVADYSGTDGFTPTVAADNKNNSFSATIRPFKKGVNNDIEQISGSIQFYKSNIPTGDYVKMPVGKLIYIGTRTPLKFVREAVLDANGNKTYDENGEQIFKEYYKILEDHEYSEIHGVGAYKLVNGKYESISPSYNSSTGIELPYIIPEGPAVYRRVLNSIYPKTIRFDSWAANNPNFNIEPWRISTNNNEAKELTLTWPLAVTPITCNKGKENEYIQLCGTSAVWIDFFAKATTFTKNGLETINGYDYIRLDKFENPEFYKDKNYSFEYFIRNRVYSKGTDTNGNIIMIPSNCPPLSYDYVDGQVINGPPKVADTITVVENGVEVQKPFDKTKHYYMTNRCSMGSDIRKSYWLNTGFYSYPRAPRELWYESTHKNKTYVSDISKVDKVPGENRSYKENLRPCLKDTFIWRWDKAFGDIYDVDEPSNYGIFLYLKSKKPRTGTNLTLITSPAYDGYYTYIVDCLNHSVDSEGNHYCGGMSSRNLVKKEVDSGAIDLNIGNIPCFEMQAKYLTLNLKELGFKSGDYCGCRIVSFIIDRWNRQIYSNVDKNSDFYKKLTNKPGNYEVTPANLFTKTSFSYENNANIVKNTDSSLYGSGGYSSQGYDPNKSFAEGGCPALEGTNGVKIGYDYNESLTDCEVRNGATVWVKISDEPNDWVEGTPWVKTEDGWKEADSLHVKADNSATGWKESD